MAYEFETVQREKNAVVAGIIALAFWGAGKAAVWIAKESEQAELMRALVQGRKNDLESKPKFLRSKSNKKELAHLGELLK